MALNQSFVIITIWVLLIPVFNGLPTFTPLSTIKIPDLNEFLESLNPAFILLNSADSRIRLFILTPIAQTTRNLSWISVERFKIPISKLVQIMIVVTQVPKSVIHLDGKISKFMNTLLLLTFHLSGKHHPSSQFWLFNTYPKQYLVHFEQISGNLKPHSGWFGLPGLPSNSWMKS